MKRAFFGLVVLATFAACTLSQSLGYLTEGPDGSADTGTPDRVLPDDANALDGATLPPVQELVTGQRAPRRLVHDADNLYWANDDGVIMTAPKSGGAPREVTKVTVAGGIDWLAVESDPGGFVYARAGAQADLLRVAKSGGAATKIAGGNPPIDAVVVDGTSVFLGRPDEFAPEGGLVVRTARDGTNPVTLVSGVNPGSMAIHDGVLVFSNTPIDENADYNMLAIAKDAVPGTTPQIYSSSTAGGPLPDSLAGFAVDKDAIYYVESGVVYRLPRLQKSAPEKLAQGQDEENETRIAIDDTFVYVAEERTGSALLRATKTGGSQAVPIAQDLARPTAVVADDKGIYFTTLGPGTDTGKVLRIAK